MTSDTNELLDRFHKVLVEEIRAHRPDLLTAPFTIAEIYQELVPYRTHRDRLGVEMNGDYEHVLLRLLAGEGEYLVLEAEAPRKALETEHGSANPNTGLYREWAAADVRLNPSRLPDAVGEPAFPPVEISTADIDLPDAPEAVSVEALAPSEEPSRTEAKEEGALGWNEAESAATAAGPGSAPQPQEVGVTEGDAKDGESTACKWCRAELPNRENLNYCPYCGTDVHVVPCPSCGEALEPDWRFCIACGAEVVPD